MGYFLFPMEGGWKIQLMTIVGVHTINGAFGKDIYFVLQPNIKLSMSMCNAIMGAVHSCCHGEKKHSLMLQNSLKQQLSYTRIHASYVLSVKGSFTTTSRTSLRINLSSAGYLSLYNVWYHLMQ